MKNFKNLSFIPKVSHYEYINTLKSINNQKPQTHLLGVIYDEGC